MPHRRTAPAIAVQVRRSYWRLACIGCFFLMAAFFAPPLSLLLFLIPLVAWYRSPVGALQWDGAAWSWNGALVHLTVRLDWQYGIVASGMGSGIRIEWWFDNPSVELRRALYDRTQHRASSQKPHHVDSGGAHQHNRAEGNQP